MAICYRFLVQLGLPNRPQNGTFFYNMCVAFCFTSIMWSGVLAAMQLLITERCFQAVLTLAIPSAYAELFFPIRTTTFTHGR